MADIIGILDECNTLSKFWARDDDGVITYTDDEGTDHPQKWGVAVEAMSGGWTFSGAYFTKADAIDAARIMRGGDTWPRVKVVDLLSKQTVWRSP